MIKNKLGPIRFHSRPHRKCSVTTFVCPWKFGPQVCLSNAEIELQYSQEKEDTKLN